jgi:hypothetical protein
MGLANDAVYTILHPNELARLAGARKPAPLRESKRWVAAKALFDEARASNLEMVVLYADAAYDCSKLIYWGKLTALEVDATGTSYTVADLAPLNRHRTQELVLRSTGKTIAERYLRPYAVIRTPSFIQQAQASSSGARSTRQRRSEGVDAILFSFGYWGAGSATGPLVDAVNEAEVLRGFEPPLWVDIRISRSVRAVGFRDGAFQTLLGTQYLHMQDLGNSSLKEGGITIRNPAAADELLRHALSSRRRRVIFFCSCEVPADCHRQVVANLVVAAAKRRGVEVKVIEWPGGEPASIDIDVSAAVLRSVERKAHTTLAVPPGMKLGAAAALPWGTSAVLHAGAETVSILVGPAQFEARGPHLKILAVAPKSGAAAAFRREHGYEGISE